MWAKRIFIGAIALVFIFLVFQSFRQYEAWHQNSIAKHLLPPYQNWNYFIFYVFTRFFAPYVFSLAAAALFLAAAKFLNKKGKENFFHPEEYWLGASAIFLTGHPGWIFYLVFLILAYLSVHLCSFFVIRKSDRLSLYWLWIPVAIFVIIIGEYLKKLPIWQLLKF